MSVIIRPEQPADYAAIYETNMRAFGRGNEPRLVDAIRNWQYFIPKLSLVAVKEGQIA